MRRNDIICAPYAPVLMESTRAIGYSVESAIADIIDNSIAAGAMNISIYFNALDYPFIAILDDGKGMSSEDITEAMRYGSSSPTENRSESDLGRYGLGLKTASLSQCRKLSVISKQKESLEGRCWDLDYILSTKEWSLKKLEEDEIKRVPYFDFLNAFENGTLVLWQNLDRIKLGSLTLEKSLETKMEDVKKHLELVFHRYLSGDGCKKTHISINGIELIPFDPFFTTKSTVVMADETIEIPGKTGKVVISPYVLPHPSNMSKTELEKYGGKDGLRNLQGFYVYRNKRLLTWGTWFKLLRMDEFSKLARVKVDIPNSLDDLWTLDIKKSTAYPPEVVKTRLKQLVGNISNGSKRTWQFRQRKEVKESVVHVWDKVETRDGVQYVVNQEHPILQTLNRKLNGEEKLLLKEYIETIQNSLPFNNLHFDMHSDTKFVQDKTDVEAQRVRVLAKSIIREAIKNGCVDITMKNFEIIEPFNEYMEDIRKVYAEVMING